jgi:hypothetical protein
LPVFLDLRALASTSKLRVKPRQRHKHTITVFLYFTHTLLLYIYLSIYLYLSLSLSHSTHTHTRCRKHWWNKHMSRTTKHALTLPSCSSASTLRFVLAVLHGRCFAQSNHTAFSLLLIEITFIFLIVLKLVMSCTLPYLHVTA